MSKPKSLKSDFRAHDKWLLYALNAGPLSALSNVMVSYTLAVESCLRGSKLILHASAATFFVLSLTGAFVARRVAAKIGPADIDDLHERTRWLATAAVVLSLGSAVLIIALEIPNLILGSCD